MNEQKASSGDVKMTSRMPVSAAFWRLVFHVCGISIVAAFLLLPFLSRPAYQAATMASEQGELLGMFGHEVWLHLGLAGCLWVMGWIGVEYVRQMRKPQKQKLVSARGIVLTETLIVMPVLLLLIFGLGQLAVNNIAGVLANLAVFQSARTVWLWEGEPCNLGATACREAVEDAARISAALVLVPAVPGAYGDGNTLSDRAEMMRGAIVGSQDPYASGDMGTRGMQMSSDILASESQSYVSFAEALDSASFISRSARKFTFAYGAVDISYERENDDLAVTMTFYHLQAFPMVGKIFGEEHTVGNRTAYYIRYERTHTQTRLPSANRNFPASS